MTFLRRDWAVSFTLTLIVLTAVLYFLQVQKWLLVDALYFQDYDGRPFIYGMLYYPSELFACVFPIGLIIFGIRLWRIRSQKIKSSTWNLLIFVGTAAFLSCGWLAVILTMTDHLYPRHFSTVPIYNRTYQFGGIAYIGGSTYLLAECDSLGIMCKAVYIAVSFEYPDAPYFGEIHLIVQPFGGLTLEIDGEPVYTSP
jgi:hypothetical protein